MSAIIKLDTMLLGNRLKWRGDEDLENKPLVYLPSYQGVVLPVEEQGTDDGKVTVNKRYRLEAKGTIQPERYMAVLTVHPELYRYFAVSAPQLIPPNLEEPYRPIVQLTALRDFDLSKLPWLVTLHLLD